MKEKTNQTNIKLRLVSMFLVFLTTASFSQTQMDMNLDSFDKYKKAEKELNLVSRQIIKMI